MNKEQLIKFIKARYKEHEELKEFWELFTNFAEGAILKDETFFEVQEKYSSKIAQIEISIRDHEKDLSRLSIKKGKMAYSKFDSIGQKKKKKKKPKKANLGLQKKMFKEIWAEREHVSELSGKFLGDEMNAWFFAHILGKGAYPHLKLIKENIMLVTQDEHWLLDQNTHIAKETKFCDPYFSRAEELKIKYR